MSPGDGDPSSWVTALGPLVALVAIVGTQFLDWGWGSDRLVPTIIGVAVAGIAVILVARKARLTRSNTSPIGLSRPRQSLIDGPYRNRGRSQHGVGVDSTLGYARTRSACGG